MVFIPSQMSLSQPANLLRTHIQLNLKLPQN